MPGSRRLVLLALLVALPAALPARLRAQLPIVALEPTVGWTPFARFYRGPVGNDAENRNVRDGTVSLEAATSWGARLTMRPAASRWSLAFDAATSETYSTLRVTEGPASTDTAYRVRTPARLTTIGLGLVHALRPAPARFGLRTHFGASIASTTFQPRRYPYVNGSQPPIAYIREQQRKPWNRRYVSPGAVAGLDASWRVRGPLAVMAMATVAVVRNETGAMATSGRSSFYPYIHPREAYWMTVPRLSLGVALVR